MTAEAQLRRFRIRFGRFNTVLMTALGVGPRVSYVELDGDQLAVHMGWAFSARLHRRAIVETGPVDKYVWYGYGAHSLGKKRWLINGSGHGVVRVRFDPQQRARTMGVPVGVRELWVSLEDPDGFLAAIGR
jgi:hypothetical protein